MATPTIEEVLSGEAAGTTVVLNTAAGTAVDDILVAIQHSDFYDVANLDPPTPGTWTQIATADLGVDEHHQRAWWRVVTSAGQNGVTFAPIVDEDVGAYLYRLRGADTTTPIDGAAGNAGTPGSFSHVAPSVSPTTADALLICTWGAGNGAYTAVPASMTQRGNVDGAPFFEMIAADEVLTSSGATGTRTATFDAEFTWVALSIAAQGAAAGITGTLAVTEADDTLAASGTSTPPPITGTVAVTEQADQLAASGTVTAPTFTGALAVTEAADTLAASGTVVNEGIAGTLAVTEQDDTLAASGTVVNPAAPVDITVLVGVTRLRQLATAGASRDRTQADPAATRLGWTVDTTRTGWTVEPTRVDRE